MYFSLKNIFRTLGLMSVIGAIFATVPVLVSADEGNLRGNMPNFEIHIIDNGNVLVRGAQVTAVSGNTITASTAIGSTTVSWLVNVSSSTDFIHKYSGKSSLADISVGDYLSFSGKMNTSASQLTVNAKVIKNWSVGETRATVSGTIESINSSLQNFVLVGKKQATTTVAVSSTTSIFKSGTTTPFSSLIVGDILKVSGIFSSQNTILTAEKIVVNVKEQDDDKSGKAFDKDFFKKLWERIGERFDKKKD
ncbi:MAG: DUF5666 domain-containing protein [Patescibacteria group bacterium]|nr:DUF5666 domain-containing protein [bacterium]MDZ4240875.1 DUF5666 domain-containing protein [Patescibacteria group bacterium]